ncbi:MAG TPA: hypothetical protein VFE28_09295 [Candidatus Krumholzibacteria bacterium]|nr:hypothetical protein [Candidatus Krumholzibacteria bacterium]
MSLPRAACLWAVVAAMLGAVGCNSYEYLRDSTQQLDQMRYEYVRNNPGNKFNNHILAGRVQPGMSRLQVRVSWGEPDQVVAGDRPGVDQLWAYAEQEPSRGVSVFQLRFGGEILQNIEISRDALILGTAKVDPKPPVESDIGSSPGDATAKRFP